MATRTIARLFDSYSDASAAVRDLEAAGFLRDDISLIANRAEDGTTTTTDRRRPRRETSSGVPAPVPRSARWSAAAPACSPASARWPSRASARSSPPVGWLRPLTGAGVGAAAGGLLGALTGSGLSEEESHVYAEGVRRGGNLVTVRTDDSRSAEVEADHAAAQCRQRRDPRRRLPRRRLDRLRRRGGSRAAASAPRPASAPPRRRGRWARAPAMGTRTDASLVGGPPDGTPGNPPGTMLSRGVDEVAGTNISGAHPENETRSGGTGLGAASAPDGTPGNPPGTKVSRAADDALGTNISGARPQNETRGGTGYGAPDGTPGNPPGTKVSRARRRRAGHQHQRGAAGERDAHHQRPRHQRAGRHAGQSARHQALARRG